MNRGNFIDEIEKIWEPFLYSFFDGFHCINGIAEYLFEHRALGKPPLFFVYFRCLYGEFDEVFCILIVEDCEAPGKAEKVAVTP